MRECLGITYCSPGERRCDSPTSIISCNAKGEFSKTPCGAGQTCENGHCTGTDLSRCNPEVDECAGDEACEIGMYCSLACRCEPAGNLAGDLDVDEADAENAEAPGACLCSSFPCMGLEPTFDDLPGGSLPYPGYLITATGQRNIRLRNVGSGTLSLGGFTIHGPEYYAFLVHVHSSSLPVYLEPGDDVQVSMYLTSEAPPPYGVSYLAVETNEACRAEIRIGMYRIGDQ